MYLLQYLIRPNGEWRSTNIQLNNANMSQLKKDAVTYRKTVSEQTNTIPSRISLRVINENNNEVIWNSLSQWDESKEHMEDMYKADPALSMVIAFVKKNVARRLKK